MARFLNNSKISDKINNKEIYSKNNLLSVNQLNCQIKLTEIWKSLNIPNYPLKWDVKYVPTNGNRVTRSTNNVTIHEKKHSSFTATTFSSDAAKVWNLTPLYLRECKTIHSFKKQIKLFVSTIPL